MIYNPTNYLRFVKRVIRDDPNNEKFRIVRILQQWWTFQVQVRPPEEGNGYWMDVPEEDDEATL